MFCVFPVLNTPDTLSTLETIKKKITVVHMSSFFKTLILGTC